MATKSIESQIRIIRLKIGISHALVVFVFSIIAMTGYYYASYYKYITYSREELNTLTHKIDEALVFDDLSALNPPKGYSLAIFNGFGDLMIGNLPRPVELKYGFQEYNRYIFLITKPKGVLFSHGYLVVGKTITPFLETLVSNLNAWLGIPLVISFLYLIGIYLISKKWFKPLVETYKSVDNFSNTFAHELLTPISTALFYITDEEVKENLIKVKKLIQNFLTFQKYHASPTKKTKVNVEEILSLVEQELSPSILEKEIKVIKSLQTKTLSSNRELLYLAIKNAIENAVRYSPPDSTVYIRSKKIKGSTVLEIENPIAKDNQQNSKGFGLGMYIMKKSITDLGGTMETEKNGRIKVKFTLPS